jgi:hypothetical protein
VRAVEGKLEVQLSPKLCVKLIHSAPAANPARSTRTEEAKEEAEENAVAAVDHQGRHARVLSQTSHTISPPFLPQLIRQLLPSVRLRLA